jgi:Spx/MgsR family transcriptional regulator
MPGSEPAPRAVALIHGIPNCDSVKKARSWFDSQGLAHTFHDFRKQGLTPDQLAVWCEALGWQAVLNRKGTTWRQLDAARQADVVDAASACALMVTLPSLVKRPLIAWPDGSLSIGVDLADYERRAAGLR